MPSSTGQHVDSAVLVVIAHQFRVNLVVKRGHKLSVCLIVGLQVAATTIGTHLADLVVMLNR